MAGAYDKKAVDRAIATSRQPISKAESKLIHSLLKGHKKNA
jgi:hypothetical protein